MPRVVNLRFESATLKLVFMEPGLLALSDLLSLDLGKGHARGVMKMAIDYADQQSCTMRLIACPFHYGTSDPALSIVQLEEFYEKFGFVKEPRDYRPYTMVRVPRKENTLSNETKRPFSS